VKVNQSSLVSNEQQKFHLPDIMTATGENPLVDSSLVGSVEKHSSLEKTFKKQQH